MQQNLKLNQWHHFNLESRVLAIALHSGVCGPSETKAYHFLTGACASSLTFLHVQCFAGYLRVRVTDFCNNKKYVTYI